MKKKVKFLKEYQGLFDPGDEMKFGPEEVKFLVSEGYAEVVEEAKPKPAPKKK